MVDEGSAPYRPRRALAADFDDFDSDFDDDSTGFDDDSTGFDDAPVASADESDPAGSSGAARHGDLSAASTPTPVRRTEPEPAPEPASSVTSTSPWSPARPPTPPPADAPTFRRPVVESVPPPPAPPARPTAVSPASLTATTTGPDGVATPTSPASSESGPHATAPAGGARRRPALPGQGYQPRHSAASTTSAPARSAHSAPARAASAQSATRARIDPPQIMPAAPARRRFSKQALLIGAVAAGLIAVLAVVYSVVTLGGTTTTAGTPSSAPTSAASATPSPDEGPLPARLMMSAAQAGALVKGSTWKIVTDTEGLSDDAVTATCLARTAETEPPAEATRIRTLAADGSTAPAAFHQSDLYPTAAEAVEAMTVRTKALGDCNTQFALLQSAAVGKNIGNSAIGVTVIVQDTPASYHTVMINRTGRLLNVVDVATGDATVAKSITPSAVGGLLAKVTDRECSFAAGLCATNPTVTETVPPIGGDTPGLLSTADIPRVGSSTGVWTSGEATRKPDVKGSNCEATDFNSVKDSTATLAKTYILADDPGFFGFDTVVMTMKDPRAAESTAADISDKINTCEDRLLTATVSEPQSFDGTGLRAATISGTTYVVTQKIEGGKTTLRYRVGVSAVGNKVVYSFADPKAKTDFTDAQWAALNVRMGQRATQVT